MQYTHDPRIDTYIKALPEWQQKICKKVRDLIHQAEPEIVETIKRTTLPYFTLNGNVCALFAAKDHINIFIYDPIADDPEHIINQGHTNATAKAIQMFEGNIINEKAFTNLIKSVVAHNRQGGWRKI